jgi:hypothetical protein
MVLTQVAATVSHAHVLTFKEAPMNSHYSDIGHAQLLQGYKSGVKWFYWIAGLSLVTSIISVSGGSWRFILSLGTTQLIDELAKALSGPEFGPFHVIGLVLDLLVTGMFVGFGLLAGKRFLWAYILGMVIFLLDGLILLIAPDVIGIIFHALVLFWMFRGLQAGRELCAYEKTMAEERATVPPPPEAVFSPQMSAD